MPENTRAFVATGAASPIQFAPVVQLTSAPPPSQVTSVCAEAGVAASAQSAIAAAAREVRMFARERMVDECMVIFATGCNALWGGSPRPQIID